MAKLSLSEVASQLPLPPGPLVPGKTKIQCYNVAAHKHGDQHPSLVLYEYSYHCYACGEDGDYPWLLRQLGKPRMVSAIPERTVPEPKPEPEYDLLSIWQSLDPLPENVGHFFDEIKGIHPDDLQYRSWWRWHTNQVPGWGEGVFMPYKFEGKFVSGRLRRMDGDPRFLNLAGVRVWPYLLGQITYPVVVITEGETDALTLNFLNVPAVGIPGATATSAIDRVFTEAKKHGTKLMAAPDNDPAGEGFLGRLQVAAFNHHVPLSVFRLPHGKDVNEWYTGASADELDKHFNLQTRPQIVLRDFERA